MAEDGPIQNYDKRNGGSKWTSRPALARLLRFAVLLLPILGSFLVTWLASSYLPPAKVGLNIVLWWLAVLLAATTAMFAIERVARRGLPLVALLKMNLVFPDEAPSRFGTALRTGTTKQLERRIEEMRLLGLHENEDVTYGQQMLELVAALNTHDRLTRGHCERVRAYTDMIIEELKIDGDDANKLRWSALLHDVGKIMVPAAIINKEGRPNDKEWEILKSHAAEGQRMVAPIADWLGEWSRSVGEHHERWDGDGYPNGFAANEIHLGARIVAVADAFDVMTSARSYKKPMPTEAAREEILRCSGSQFDPAVVRAFLNIGIGRLRLAMGPLTWLANVPSAGQIPIAPVATPLANVAASAVGATAALITGGAGVLLPEDVSVPEPVVAFVDEEPIATTAPPFTTSLPPVTLPVTEGTVAPIATTSTTTTSTTLPPPEVIASAPTTTSTTTTTTIPGPIANDTSVNINEDEPVTITLSGVSGSGSPSFEIIVQPQHGTLTKISGGGSGTTGEEIWQFAPDLDFSGSDTIVYRVCDDRGTCDLAEVTIAITAQNDAPVSSPDQITASEDQPTTIPIASLLGNDIDVDDSPEFSEHSQPQNGTLTRNDAGDLVYTPNVDFNGIDSFTYTITDGTFFATETVTVEVTASNDPPVAGDDTFTTAEDTFLTISAATMLSNDVDVESSPTFDGWTQPTNGVVTQNASNDFVYTPNVNFNGDDTFTYTITDGTLTDTATVSIAVSPINDRPTALNDTVTTPEDVPLVIVIADLLANDGDVEAPPAFDSYTQPTDGVLSVGITGDLIYTPGADFNGDDSFTYTLTDSPPADSPLTDNATVTIAVTPANDRPVALADAAPGTEDQKLEILVADLLNNDSDVESALTLDSFTQPANGVLTISPSRSTITYQPTPNFNGDDSFTYTITDGTLTDSTTVTITLAPVNDAPEALVDSFTTDEDVPLVILSADLLSNDIDVESTPTIDSYTQPTHGVVTTAITGDLLYSPAADYEGFDSFTYTITDGEQTDTATVTIDVGGLNDPPIAVADAIRTDEDITVDVDTATLLANDSDAESTPTLESFTQPTSGIVTISPSGSQISYTPNPDFNGADSFTYTITDGFAFATATVEILVVAINDPPEGADDSGFTTTQRTMLSIPIVDLLANDTDTENSALNIGTLAATTGGTVAWSLDGLSVEFLSDVEFAGEATFEYAVCDFSGLCELSNTVVSIDVTNVNDAPVAVDDVLPNSPEDSLLFFSGIDLTANDTDPDLVHGNETLTVTIDSASAEGGIVTSTGPGTFVYQPAADFHGPDSFKYQITDAAGVVSASAQVSILVTEISEPPVAVNDGSGASPWATVEVGETVTLADVRTNDTDDEDTPSSFVVTVSSPSAAGGTLALDPAGLVIYSAPATVDGPDSFTYTVTDSGSLTSASATVFIQVENARNDAPTGVPDAYSISEDGSIVIPWNGPGGLLSNDTDLDFPFGDLLSITGASADDGADVVVDAVAKTVKYAPVANFNGDATFTYDVCDLDGLCDLSTSVTISVASVDEPPIAEDDHFVAGGRFEGPQGIDMTIPLSEIRANDFNPDDPTNANGAAMTYTLASTFSANGAQVSQSGAGADFILRPLATYHGTDTFEYEVCNLASFCDTAIVTVNITDVNHAPEITVAVPHSESTPFGGAEDTDWASIMPTVDDSIDAQTGDIHVWSITSGILPAGLSLDAATGVISGRPALGSSGNYDITLVVSDGSSVTPGAFTDSISLQFVIADWQLSDLHDDWHISEIRYRETAPDATGQMTHNWDTGHDHDIGVLDEFIEVVNVSTGPLDVGQLVFTDINAKELDVNGDPVVDKFDIDDLNSTRFLEAATTFTYSPPSQMIPAGGHAVIWMTPPGGTPEVIVMDPDNAGTELFRYEILPISLRPAPYQYCACVTAPLLGNAADEVFVIDQAGRIVDFAAWDDGTNSGKEKSAYPLELKPSFTPNVPAGADPPGTSVSLATYDRPPGERFSSTTCWEVTGSGTATCAGADTTISIPADPTPFESYGERNFDTAD